MPNPERIFQPRGITYMESCTDGLSSRDRSLPLTENGGVARAVERWSQHRHLKFLSKIRSSWWKGGPVGSSSPSNLGEAPDPVRKNPMAIPLDSISKCASLLAIVTGLAVLIGWLLAPIQMIRHLPFLAHLSPNSAAIVILIAFSLRLSRFERVNPWARWVSEAFRVAVGLMGLLGMSEAVFGWDLGWESLLFRRGAAIPDFNFWLHTSVITVLCFYILACSLILLSSRRGYWACQILTIAVVVIVFGTLVQRLYGFRPLALHLEVPGIASLLLLVLAVGILDSNLHRGLMAVVSSRQEGGLMARRLLPASIVIPVMLGWIRLWGEQTGWFRPDTGLVLHVLFTIVVLSGFVWWNAGALNRSSRRYNLSEQSTLEVQVSYRRLLEDSTDGFLGLNLQGDITSWNSAAKELFGGHDKTSGISIFATLAIESRQPIRQLLSNNLLAGPCGHESIVIRSAAGKAVRVEAYITVMTRDGNPQGYMMLLRRPQDLNAGISPINAESREFAMACATSV
jgi:PAS domain S-box-containing protein